MARESPKFEPSATNTLYSGADMPIG
jgi:hypothetical protein